MDALDEHLDSLACLGTVESQGSFTLARGEVWNRLRQALPDGRSSLRFLLRWLHARGATAIAIEADRSALKLVLRAELSPNENFPALGGGEDLDYSGSDIDLARAAVSAQMMDSLELHLAVERAGSLYCRSLAPLESWSTEASSGGDSVAATYKVARSLWPLVEQWEKETRLRFRCSPLPLCWNGEELSGPYTFSLPVVIWRHLRRTESGMPPLVVMSPPTAVEGFRSARHAKIDVVLGMVMGFNTGLEDAQFQLLRHGELLELPEASRELAGFAGLFRANHLALDIQGLKPVWNETLDKLVASLKDEAVDMAVQLYRLETPLEPRQAESVFLGMQSVLLHLLDHQRFTEGHLLANWLREAMGENSPVLSSFRTGYTFDMLCSLLAEPAGQPQTSLRWAKQAEGRVRDRSSKEPRSADEALLITARLQLRARRDKPVGLAGDLQGKLLQLAAREKARGNGREAADIYTLLGLAFPESHPERADFLERAASCR